MRFESRYSVNQATLLSRILISAVLGLLSITIILPVWNVLIVSFTGDMESYENVFKFWPRSPSFSGYVTLFDRVGIWRPFLNTVTVTTIGTAIHVMVNAMAGFALTRPKFPGKAFIAVVFLIPMMIPGESIIIPRYIVMKQLGLLNTLWSVTVNNIAHTFAIFPMRNYFLSIPDSLEQSARIDGASHFQVFRKIHIPLSTAGLATITLLEMVGKWNTLFSAVLYFTSPSKYILQQALKVVVVDTESPFTSGLSVANNAQAAGIVIALVPMLLLYPFMQRYFIKGIYLGATKEWSLSVSGAACPSADMAAGRS